MKIKSNFLKLIRQKNSVLTEQDLPAPPPPAPAPGTEVVDQEQIKVDIKEPEKERFKELTPEGEVELIRLIRKALVLEPTEGTIPPVILDDEINEEDELDWYTKQNTGEGGEGRHYKNYPATPNLNRTRFTKF